MVDCFFVVSITHTPFLKTLTHQCPALCLHHHFGPRLESQRNRDHNADGCNDVGASGNDYKLGRAKQKRTHRKTPYEIWTLQQHQVATFQQLAHGLAVEWIAKWSFCVNPLRNNKWHCRSVEQRRLLSAGRPRGDHSRTAGVREKYYSSYVNNVILHGIPACNCGMIMGGCVWKGCPYRSSCLFKQRELCF